MTLDGTIAEGTPRAGVWLMPDNQSPGELEDFVIGLTETGDKVWPLAEAYIDNIPNTVRKFKPGKILRARLHAWLAARAEPRKMGAAIGAGDLDAKAPTAEALCAWLRRLFRLTGALTLSLAKGAGTDSRIRAVRRRAGRPLRPRR